jgi:hypothetical protein
MKYLPSRFLIQAGKMEYILSWLLFPGCIPEMRIVTNRDELLRNCLGSVLYLSAVLRGYETPHSELDVQIGNSFIENVASEARLD